MICKKMGKQTKKERVNLCNIIGNTTTGGAWIDSTTPSVTTWQGGWVTDNFETYYLDENFKRKSDGIHK